MDNFYEPVTHGFVRVAACNFPVALGHPQKNAESIVDILHDCAKQGVHIACFPELSLTGYTCEDLFQQPALLDAVELALNSIALRTTYLNTISIVGAPLRFSNHLFNCAVVIYGGEIKHIYPKTSIPNYGEFYESRFFASSRVLPPAGLADFVTWHAPYSVGTPFGVLLVPDSSFPEAPHHSVLPNMDDAFGFTPMWKDDDDATPEDHLRMEQAGIIHFQFGIEICEDLWAPHSAGSLAANSGAEIIFNLSASPATVGRSRVRDGLCMTASRTNLCAYVYTAAGEGESSTDLSFDGQASIYELGRELARGTRFSRERQIVVSDINIPKIRAARLKQNTFQTDLPHSLEFPIGALDMHPEELALATELRYPIDRFPFVPDDVDKLAADCAEAIDIQVHALMRRLTSIGSPKIIIGVSGGLDSTHALLVAATAMDRLGRPRTDILAYTMPGFATTEHTKSNAQRLSEVLGVTFHELDIRPAARQMLADMGHPFARGEEVYDVAFENVQAGLRTDYLFRLANNNGGIVLGTGDLSELALGWCTFGVGDHMSHYNVNCGVPKTLMQHLVRHFAATDAFGEATSDVLTSILNTEITPELIPTREGEEAQSTQASIGPYGLHDFFLYHLIHEQLPVTTVAYMASSAWGWADRGTWPPNYPEAEKTAYSMSEIKKWLRVFIRRFFSSQFKRSTVPNGPKVHEGGTLSPRGEWRMPSDALADVWLADVDRLPDM